MQLVGDAAELFKVAEVHAEDGEVAHSEHAGAVVHLSKQLQGFLDLGFGGHN